MANPLSEIFCPISGEIIQQNHGIKGSISTFLSCFEEESELGSGGFGVAVKCRHKIDGISYVVKKIGLQETGMSFEKIRREVEILGKLNHPNIIRYYFSWVEGHIFGLYYESDDHLCAHKADSPCLYIQMEFCPNKLSDYLLNGKMVMARRLAFIRQLVDAVKYMHSMGIIHRDLSCENILLDGHLNIKLIDFGQAVGSEKDHVHSNSFGARYYMAPELKRGEQIDSNVDIFSLGVLFSEVLKEWKTKQERILFLLNLQNEELRSSLLNDMGARGLLIKEMLNDDPKQRPSASLIQELMPWTDDFEYVGIEQVVAAEQAITDVEAFEDEEGLE